MTLFTPFHKWVTEEHKLFTESVQKFYNDVNIDIMKKDQTQTNTFCF